MSQAISQHEVGTELRQAAGNTRRALHPLRSLLRSCLLPIAERAAKAYVAGEHIEDAMRVARHHAAAGRAITVGLFNEDDELPQHVADVNLQALAAVGQAGGVAVKLPAIGFSQELAGRLAAQALRCGSQLVFDSLWPESVPQTLHVIENLLQTDRPSIGLALPARWRRSPADARWAADRGLTVRVVKGQWSDPDEPERDARHGYMQVIEELAGRAPYVAIASHDAPLVASALDVLQRAGTPHEIELLHGLPMRPVLALAQRRGVKVRVYVPFGSAHLPYAIAQVLRKPRMAWWLLKDLVGLS